MNISFSSFKFILFVFWLSLFSFSHADPQKSPDKPKDRQIAVDIQGSTYCYVPNFTGGEGYIYLDYCSSPYALPARYDLFQRIAFEVNSKWICITAPNSVTAFEPRYMFSDWGYVVLRPCVLDDPNQKWIVKNNSFYTFDGKFRLQDYKWYGIISKDNSYNTHTLNRVMNEWAKTVAPPPTLAFKTYLAWTIVDRYGMNNYYIGNNRSFSGGSAPELYYNSQDGRIFTYYPGTGSTYCMTSTQQSYQNWNWVYWYDCGDTIKNPSGSSWDLFMFSQGTGFLRDQNNNVLRVTRYGSNWGVPYTVKFDYLDSDTTFSPVSEFHMSIGVDRWLRYADANMSDNLEYCPAPGYASDGKTRTKRQIPPSFRLTDEWINRLYAIATTAVSGTRPLIGLCGTCLMHTYQMIAELMAYGYGPPPTNRGYFFDIGRNINPLDSFSERFPQLAQRILDTNNFFDYPSRVGEHLGSRRRRAIYSMTLALLSQYNWFSTDNVSEEEDVRNIFFTMLNSPAGTIWFYAVTRDNQARTEIVGHSQPIVRTQDGLVFLPTNVPTLSLERFRSYLVPITNVEDFMGILTFGGTRRIHDFMAFRVTGHFDGSYDRFLSQNNCTGEGEGRRGTATFPSISTINQCSSGRCSIQ